MKPYKTKGDLIMGEKIRELLNKRLESEINGLDCLPQGSPEHSAAVESFTKLYKLKLEEDKNELEHNNNIKNRESDEYYKNAQMNEAVKELYFKYGMTAVELFLTLGFYGIWMRRGFKFEEKGVFTSQTFRGLFSRFKPTKN